MTGTPVIDNLLQTFIFGSGFSGFSAPAFLVTFFLFMLIYTVFCRTNGTKVAWALFFSALFYWWVAGFYIIHLSVLTVANFFLAKIIIRTSPSRRKMILSLGVVFNIAVLCWFKYAGFLGEALEGAGLLKNSLAGVLLPVGMSFYMFQMIGYLVDVYRDEKAAIPGLHRFSLFVAFFPKILAGPIVRSRDVGSQLLKPPVLLKEEVGRALMLIISGIFKKTVIADYLASNFVDRVFDSPGLFSGLENLMAVYGYALQIYCDFSGYTDMAIGMALMIGYRLPANFDSPYQSLNLTEFWRRWHISLSNWLRDYLYIPLGGNRKGAARQYLNVFITMAICGLWHGAALGFLVWGIIHGFGLMAHRSFRTVFKARENPALWARILSGVVTFHFVCFAWIFFRASDLGTAQVMIKQIALSFNGHLLFSWIAGYPAVTALLLTGFALHFLPRQTENVAVRVMTTLPVPAQSVLLSAMVWLAFQVKSAAIQKFIYLQF